MCPLFDLIQHQLQRRSVACLVKAFLLLVMLLSGGCQLKAQIGNLAYFDNRLMHYGIQVGYSQSKFDLELNRDPEVRNVAYGVRSYYTAGFHISIVGDLRLGNYLNFRLLPGILLLTRGLNFSWDSLYEAQNPLLERTRSVESVYGQIPFEIKFRAWRVHNFRPYLTVGGCYGFDFASLRKNKNNNNESIIRLEANDLSYTMGVGFDVFLTYVKFAIEFKMMFGTVDLKIPDDEIYTATFNALSTRTFMLSFTFEG